jgi:2,5-furandicarboxylate decarboxylase 1
MSKDLRTYLRLLDEQAPAELIRVGREVDPNLQLTAILRRLQADGRSPVLLFEKVKGTSIPVLTNTLATRERLGFAFGSTAAEVVTAYTARQGKWIAPVLVTEAPVQEVVQLGEAANLLELTQIVHCGDDAGAYIGSGVTVVKDPETGCYNMGMYRTQIAGRNRVRLYPVLTTHLMHLFLKAERLGQPLEVAWVVGHHPAFLLASQYRGPLDLDDRHVAGGLMGEPLRMVPAKTLSMDVPADAEIVIEARMLPGVRELEGPFGEFSWTLGPAEMTPVAEVAAITRRRDAIFLDVFNAHPEHNLIGMIGREATVFQRVKASMPAVKAVALPMSGTCRFTCYVSIGPSHPAAGRHAALAALAADPIIKLVVVVDDDIDVYDDAQVLWAMATRVQPDRDVIVIPDAWTNELDPAAHQPLDNTRRGGMNGKWIVDATRPVGLPSQPRADVPEEIWRSIRLEDFLPAGSA